MESSRQWGFLRISVLLPGKIFIGPLAVSSPFSSALLSFMEESQAAHPTTILLRATVSGQESSRALNKEVWEGPSSKTPYEIKYKTFSRNRSFTFWLSHISQNQLPRSQSALKQCKSSQSSFSKSASSDLHFWSWMHLILSDSPSRTNGSRQTLYSGAVLHQNKNTQQSLGLFYLLCRIQKWEGDHGCVLTCLLEMKDEIRTFLAKRTMFPVRLRPERVL